MIIINETDIFIVDETHKGAHTLVEKLCKKHNKPGSIIYVTHDEFMCFKDGIISISTQYKETEGAKNDTA